MARVKYDPNQVHQNLQIEDAIRDTLGKCPTAAVSVSVIESCYELEDDEFEPIDGTLEHKCKAIAKIVGAPFSVVRDNVVFKK